MRIKIMTIAIAVLTAGLLVSCSNAESKIDSLEKKIDGIENAAIKSIREQIDAISASVSDLGKIRTDIQTLISTADNFGDTIVELRAADKALCNRIAELDKFVNNTLSAYAKRDWVNATFATLQQHQWTCDTIAKIDVRIGALDSKLSLDIECCEKSVRSWICDTLGAYYTAAQMDARIMSLLEQLDTVRTANKSKISELASDLAATKAAVDTAKTSLRTEYKSAIKTAIETSEGVMNASLQTSISTVNGCIDALTVRVSALETSVSALTDRVERLEKMIQSVTIIPVYSDGSVESAFGTLTIDFVVKPATSVHNIAKDSIKVLVNTVSTKSATYTTLPAKTVSVNETTGDVTITADIASVTVGEGRSLTVAVNVKNGISDFASEFVPVTFWEPQYVDLGLSVKWATCNVGANKPEDYGSYFAWGEITTKSRYHWSSLTYCLDNNGNKFSKYVSSSSYGTVDNKITLELSDDAARANWGGSWRMPTATEIDELLNNCTWEWTTQNGVNGYKVTGKKFGYTDKSIFLPAAGYRNLGNLLGAGSGGYYWSSSLSTSFDTNAYYLFQSIYHDVQGSNSRYYGQSVRPVCPSESYVFVTEVKLNTTSVSLEVGDTTTLTATVSPSNATDKSVTWKSSNTTVATVDSYGKVTAKFVGTATITVTTTDGSNTATCTVTVNADGKENGHDYVDLGLPSGIKWATCNVGASKPENYGSYFAWGETSPKSSYDWENLKYHTSGDSYENVKFSKYVSDSNYGTVDNRTTLELSDDAARANWGGRWRMPTATEIDELLNNCTWTWITLNGVNGYKVTSNKSGYTDKSIFLPVTGFRSNGSRLGAGSDGYYWSSSLNTNDSFYAYKLYFNSSTHYRVGGSIRCSGQSVRPVCPSGSYVSVTGVKLNTTSLSLEVGGTSTLTATVSPSDATDKSVTWESNNTTVATVDSDGKITAKSDGTATITVTTTDGNFTATCTVTVNADGKENGYDYVDLGLPSGVKWATCNIGATKQEDYGDYFAWGETSPKSNYSWSNLKYCLDSIGNKFSKYVYSSSYGTVDNRTTLEVSDDAAHANWGGNWRMPTDAEFDELLNNCTWTWTTQNGVSGYKVTGKKAGYTDKSIFFPAAGCRYNGNLYDAGSSGNYWSSSLNTSSSFNAFELSFFSGGRYRYINNRCCGRSVRPVCP